MCLGPKCFECRECYSATDSFLALLVMSILSKQVELSQEWEILDNSEDSIVGKSDEWTSMWRSFMLLSPLEYDWGAVDPHSTFDRSYVDIASCMLDVQMKMWFEDEPITKTRFMNLFQDFSRSVTDLNFYLSFFNNN